MSTTAVAAPTNPLASTNPFAAEDRAEPRDEQLVAEALAGSRPALDGLVARHQRWIYNIAFRMVMTPQDAEDVTQEVLIKVLTKLSSYDPGKAAFRTWLYRIVTNHVINMKSRGYEAAMTSLESYYTGILRSPTRTPKPRPRWTRWRRTSRWDASWGRSSASRERSASHSSWRLAST